MYVYKITVKFIKFLSQLEGEMTFHMNKGIARFVMNI